MHVISRGILVCTAMMLVIVLNGAACAHRLRGAEMPHPQWSPPTGPCLALSGGGLRSGAVSLGVLQALESTGALGGYAFISSVSGGGYPVYGVAYQLIKKQAALTQLLAEDSDYIRHVDKRAGFIGGRADVALSVPLALFLWTPLSWLSHYSAAQPTYSAQIHGTFAGGPMGLWGNPKLAEGRALPSLGFPNIILGASVKVGKGAPHAGHRYAAADYFEMATDSSGSPSVGYYAQFSEEVEFREAIAISGAAVDAPEGGLPDILKAIKLGLGSNISLERADGRRISVFLSDGGFVENLGILPLLRRGCSDILVFDNTHDPGATFKSWANFVGKAAEEGWYLEQELTPELRTTSDAVMSAWSLPSHNWDASVRRADITARIRLVKLGIDGADLANYPAAVRAFARKSWVGDRGCTGAGLGLRCSFPMEATERQSFSVEELRAYRHLGHCLAARALAKPQDCPI